MQAADAMNVLYFKAAGFDCAIRLETVKTTLRPATLRVEPDMPSFVLGHTLLHGMALPVVDLGKVAGHDVKTAERFLWITTWPQDFLLAIQEMQGIHTVCTTSFLTARHVPGNAPLRCLAGTSWQRLQTALGGGLLRRREDLTALNLRDLAAPGEGYALHNS